MPITKEQREERRNFLGSSDAAAVLNLDGYRNTYDVYAEKVGLVDRGDFTNDAIDVGNYLEEGVIRWFCDKMGVQPILNRDGSDNRRVHINGVMSANIDCFVAGDPSQAIEAKTHGVVSGRIDDAWGEIGTSEVPDRVAVQCLHQMAVVPTLQVVWVPVLLGGVGLRYYRIDRNDSAIANIEEAEMFFWENHVKKKVAPSDFTPSMETIKRMKRVPNKTVHVEDYLVQEWLEAKDRSSVADKLKEEKQKALLAALGDAEAGICSLGDVAYPLRQRKGYTVEASEYRQLTFKKIK